MLRRFGDRLAALEALEARQERWLAVFVQMRPDDYIQWLRSGELPDGYGFDQLGEDERVSIWIQTWPAALHKSEITIYHHQTPDNYGVKIDVWPGEWPDAPGAGDWRWSIVTDDATNRRCVALEAELVRRLAPLDVGELGQALADLDTGLLRVRGYVSGTCTIHMSWVHYGSYGTPWPSYYEPLCAALDRRNAYVNSSAELRTVLMEAINEQTHTAN